MERRVAPLAALFVVLSVAGVAFAAAAGPGPGTLAAVTWSTSTLLVSEIQTGGASASDEFAEITNVGPAPVDLAGLELVYVTSTGGTVTRKASWSASTTLEPGRHLFVANTSGIYAALADATYSGGFAATGGAIVLRPIGGAPIDALGWGDATNAFVEGAPIAAPAAGSTVERKPGGVDGNTIDTNDNASDFLAQASPNPQSLAAPPVPAPGASPTPAPSPTATAAPPPTASPEPSATPGSTPTGEPTAAPTPSVDPTTDPTPSVEPSPTVEATAEPTLEPTPTPTPTPTPAPTATPTLTPVPTAGPTATPTAAPEPTGTPVPITAIADARLLANGSSVQISGVLTTALGALETGRKAFVQDATGGIALYLDASVVGPVPAGTRITVAGSVDDRFAERTLRVSEADIAIGALEELPVPAMTATGSVAEPVEGLEVVVAGITVGSPSALSDGLGLMVDDGTGQVRVIVGPDVLGGLSIPSGTHVSATGPVGQRDSTGTGLAGYRIHATLAGSFTILPTPSPTPNPTPTPTAGPAATPTATLGATPPPTPAPTGTPTPTSRPSPTATPGPTPPPALMIVEARGAPVGMVVTVSGVVTAEGGRLGLPPLIAIADGTGGIVVRLPDGVATPARGALVTVRGPLADPYGQLEIRPTATGFGVNGSGSLPAAVHLAGRDLGEQTEGRLATLTGTAVAAPTKGTSGDITVDLVDSAGTSFRVLADGSSQVSVASFAKGRTYTVTGIVGQRASRKGALDGYRLYVRDQADVVPLATGPTASGSPAPATPIATALAQPDGSPVTVEATVTAGASLLDSSGRRVIVQDATGAIEVVLPSGTSGSAVGTRLHIAGTMGHAWGAPRVLAARVQELGSGSALLAQSLGRAPGERDEWLLVRLSGTVLSVHRTGDKWLAEVQLANGSKVPVQGQAGAGIPSTAIVAGRRITVTGIVKRPYPTASDRRYALLPRGGSDVAIGPADGDLGATTTPAGAAGTGAAGGTATKGADITPDTDLAVLGDHVGQRVRVGGLIARLAGDGFDLDDGTAIAHVILRDDMAALIAHLAPGEAVAATGTVELVNGAPMVIVDDAGSLVRVGALGQALPIGGAAEDTSAGAGSDPVAPVADVTDGAFRGGIGPSGLFILALLTTLAVTAGTLRRRLERRRLRAVLVDRLATLGSQGTPARAATLDAPGPAERGHA